jgi:hypothetical protein
MNIKKFTLRTDEDPSVGLFASEWQIEGDFTFENDTELEVFEERLIDFWQENVYNDYLSVEHELIISKQYADEVIKAQLYQGDIPLLVTNSQSFEELALVIELLADENGFVQGCYEKHDAKKMADRCRDFSGKFIPVNAFTRMYGIRDKVIELKK